VKSPFQKAALITLGCPKNQVDSEVLAGLLAEQGVVLTRNPAEADAVLINTCGFIQDAKQESIDAILKSLELKKTDPAKKVVVWGCLAERYRGEIEKAIPEADVYFGVEPFDSIGRFFFGRSYRWNRKAFHARTLSTPPHTAYLKIADGCDHACTFCAIPQFKGRYRSRTIESLVEEAERLAGQGVRELNLVAQDSTAYGADLKDGSDLPTLLGKLADLRGLAWIRILYAHPEHITDVLVERMADEKKICRYLDLPLQHIADPVLQAMGRNTSGRRIGNLISTLRKSIPGLALRTAFIVGFPGESGAAFRELERFVEETRFERLGVFRYSKEEGTAAAALINSVPARVAEERYRHLMERQNRISAERNRRLESDRLTVLVDGYDAEQGLYFGRTEFDAPEIDQTVWIRGNVRIGGFVDTVIDGSSAYDLSGHPAHALPKGEDS